MILTSRDKLFNSLATTLATTKACPYSVEVGGFNRNKNENCGRDLLTPLAGVAIALQQHCAAAASLPQPYAAAAAVLQPRVASPLH